MDFSIELAKNFLKSDEKFPIELDIAWQWLGYAQKQNALSILKAYFKKEVDFVANKEYTLDVPRYGRPRHTYYLTLDCFVAMAKMARSGKVVSVLDALGYSYIVPCLEVQTIVFIQRAFSHIYSEPQFRVNGYYIDLYFPSYRLAIECDEVHHSKKEKQEEDITRQSAITKTLKCKFIRIKPKNHDFYLAEKIQEIIANIYGV